MPHIFSYRDEDIYCHHTVDPHPDPEAFSMHAHERMEVFYFISGRGSYLVEGTAYPLQPGDVLIMRPAETHRLAISPDEPYERISFHFAPALLSGLDILIQQLTGIRTMIAKNPMDCVAMGIGRVIDSVGELGGIVNFRTR